MLTRPAEPPGCDDIRAYQERYGEVETLGTGPEPVTVLGDSYSAGDTLSDRGHRWTDVLVELEPNVTVTLDAVPFTGYANAGACGANAFTDRVERAAASEGALVIQGGLNDVFADPAALERAADDVLTAAGTTQVVVIGPIDVPGREREEQVDAALRAAADAHGADYVSALDWDVPIAEDGVHPTVAGDRRYAELVRDALADAGVL
ncbi:SGNH/GDSL hydrolase family protein [Microbacterium dauci]|uniref:SGNH/GDSL hydrolase family protein n=1 Tax=Microbacterium dauci TaxID=3048008 RepID=A0ABT6ZEW8_9MICO|nr:SGNH/GDSL hydrolase family protein [Microbacterium sp. LX3-4]MDJ1114717.1 SGNH/GDSL hydrolase family protein [Microbacterium sp. LX3-4]